MRSGLYRHFFKILFDLHAEKFWDEKKRLALFLYFFARVGFENMKNAGVKKIIMYEKLFTF